MPNIQHILTRFGALAKILLPAVMLSLALPALAGEIKTDVDPATVSKSRATPLGLYLTPKAAHQALVADPRILMIDVRDPIEVSFIGHPDGMDQNIPIALATYELNPQSGTYKMVSNPNFLAEVAALLKREGLSKSDPIIVTCRSGTRSGAAARVLIKAGYSNVWNQIEGFEGSKNSDGVRARNGWRNAGLPWSYKLTPKTAWAPFSQ
jgi:rhodanese-related sulfurtransferase